MFVGSQSLPNIDAVKKLLVTEGLVARGEELKDKSRERSQCKVMGGFTTFFDRQYLFLISEVASQ